MKSLKDLREERASKIDAQGTLLNLVKQENRDMNAEEETRFNNLDTEISDLDAAIARAEKVEAAEKRLAAQKLRDKSRDSEFSKSDEKRMANYSLHSAVKSQLRGQSLQGFEKEMDEEARNEARYAGKSIEGIGIPTSVAVRMITGAEKRDMTAGTDANGGFFVPTDVEQTVIGALRPRLVLANAGAVTLGGLNGDVSMPRTGGVSVSWKTENGEADETTPTIDQVTLSPKRVTGYTDVTRQLIRQSSPDVEAMLREDFFGAVAAAIDAVGINGGGSNEPTGILSTAGIGAVYAGGAASAGTNANGAAPVRADVVNLEKAVALQNADQGSLAYITNPLVRAALKNKEISTGAGRFVWEDNDELMGYRAFTTSNVPSNLSKGAASDLSALIFGNFRDLIIGQWGGLDLIVNEYTKAKSGMVEMIVHQYLDVALRQAKSFAAVQDIVAS